jgi:acyl-CoA synthetase (AMP-forming)/AMP-acid ligase II
MHLSALIEMVESGLADRVLVDGAKNALTGEQLADRARRGASLLAGAGALVYAGENHPELPVLVLAAAWAGVPFVPVNYRLEDEQLAALIHRVERPMVVADDRTATRLDAHGIDARTIGSWLGSTIDAEPLSVAAENDDDVAIVLYTSGTTAEPKAALLRHRHLMAYLLGAVEYASAEPDEAVLISVPPYHIAGMANLLSNLFAGRRLVYLENFSASGWLQRARESSVTHAMVVPTMLSRIVDALDAGEEPPAALRSLSYGGSRTSPSVLERALTVFPNTGFVNAYGLTETASTIALLGPDDHREALASDDPLIRRRLSSAGRLLPMVEAEIRDDDGQVVPAGDVGILFLRGEQIAGEYSSGSLLDTDGWFCTRDHAFLDEDGFLFIEGRADDTIIRGGENIAPAEIEDALTAHPAVGDACVLGVPDDEWGQRIVAAVVLRPGASATPDEIRDFVARRLRSSRTPERIDVVDELPRTPTGKVLRRVLLSRFI